MGALRVMLMILAAMWGVVRKVMDFQFEMILLIVIAFWSVV